MKVEKAEIEVLQTVEVWKQGKVLPVQIRGTVIAVKKINVKRGRHYGPYPKAPDEYYLYEQTWNPEKKRPRVRYLGRGKKPAEALVKEVEGVVSFLGEGLQT